VTAVSEYLREETYRAFQCRRTDIRVIPNFIDPEVFDRTRYECHGAALAPGGEKIVMHISNFRPVKRVGDVVAAFAGIRSSVPARLVFVGDGPERAHAWEEVTRRGLEEDVVFLGKLESVAELLSCADLFLLPSEMESFGLVALEAMASGVPVIGASGSGLNEVVEDGETGYLHPVGDVAAMSESGIRLLSDPELWKRMSVAARQRAVERFHVDHVIPKYEAFYEEVLGS
jgi:N-acetyl-alpha-D-glucosaminyl L-malate synthase BshA